MWMEKYREVYAHGKRGIYYKLTFRKTYGTILIEIDTYNYSNVTAFNVIVNTVWK